MRIAQIAPLYESVPPQLYGGTDATYAYRHTKLTAKSMLMGRKPVK